MNHSIRPAEMTALITALLAVYWLQSAVHRTAYLSVLLTGVLLTALCVLLSHVTPQRGLLTVCTMERKFRYFPLFAATVLLFLAADALRAALNWLCTSLLPETPRWIVWIFLLAALIPMCLHGTAAVPRMVKLLAPVFVALFTLVMLLSGWGKWNVYRIFPLLGNGMKEISSKAVSLLPAGVWLLLPVIDRAQLGSKYSGWHACAAAAGIAAAGAVYCTLCVPPMALPVQLTHALGRMQAVFVLAWLPLLLAAAAVGIGYAARCVQTVFPANRSGLAAWVMLACTAVLSLLPQVKWAYLLVLPLLVPMAWGRLQEKRLKKEADGHA